MTKMPFIYFEDLFILFSSIKLGNLHVLVGGAYMLVKVKILTLVLSMRHEPHGINKTRVGITCFGSV